MVPIKEALTFDDVTLVPKYSEILPSEVDTSIIKQNDAITYKITGYANDAGRDYMLNIDAYTPSNVNYSNTVESSVTFMEIKV